MRRHEALQLLGRMAPRVTTHCIWHAWARSLFQENSAASEGKTWAGCCTLFPSAPLCIFIKYPGNAVKATFYLPRASCTTTNKNKADYSGTETRPYCSVSPKLSSLWGAQAEQPVRGSQNYPLQGLVPAAGGPQQQRYQGRLKGQKLLQQGRTQKYQEQSSHTWDLKSFTAPQHGEKQEQVLTFAANKYLKENWRMAKFTLHIYSLTIDLD